MSRPSLSTQSDILPRIQLVQLEVNRLQLEGQRAAKRNDIRRLTAIREEMEVLLESMREIRREQLMEQMRPKASKKRWWRRGR